MLKHFALYAPADGEGDAGGGATGGEDEGSGKSKVEVVPKTQFIAALNSAEEKHKREMQALREEMDAKLAAIKQAPAETKRYTRAELSAMMDAGQITQEQADAQMDFQTREDAKADAKRVTTETITAAQHKERVETEIARYKAVAPEILDDANEIRQRIRGEFTALIELGDDPKALSTQLKAIRAVLGPVDKLERARGGKPAHESHREYGGGMDSSQSSKKKSDTLTYDDLSPREKAHYDKGLQSGLYKDKAEVNAELKFAKSHIRQKYGAMA